MNSFDKKIKGILGGYLHAESVDIIQVNIGFRCNQECKHCHHESSLLRDEMMSWDTMQCIVKLVKNLPGLTVDITGGSPELNPYLMRFIEALHGCADQIKLRSNLTLLSKPEYRELLGLLSEYHVHIIGSMPCYTRENVDAQRGSGVFDKSIHTLKMLNSLGYGRDTSLRLTLVYNPLTGSLPPRQQELEEDYRKVLRDCYGIVFTDLITITNMPIGRFLDELRMQGKDREYYRILVDSFNKDTLPRVMCRRQITIGWDGGLYDCDFNLALGLPVMMDGLANIKDCNTDSIRVLSGRRINTGDHCFGCVAGYGSSCTGVLV